MLSVLGVAGGGYYIIKGLSPGARRDEASVDDSKPAPKQENDELLPPSIATPRLEQSLIDLINAQRQHDGVPVLTLHEGHSRGCRDHAEYLALHLDRPLLDPHDQEDLPGTTLAGKEAAHAASIAPAEPRAALREWLTSPAHRMLLLSPGLASVGVGFAKTQGGKWISVFDFTRGSLPAPRAPDAPVAYPAHRQLNVPLIFPGNEVPDPLPAVIDKLAGYPITLTFPPNVAAAGFNASLEDEYGQEVPAWFSSPTRPANDKYPHHQQNTVCLIPKAPLRAGTRYVARVEARQGDREWSQAWTFTTQAPAEYGRRIYQRAVAQLNAFRTAADVGKVDLDDELSLRCQAHAGYVALNLDRVPDLRITEERENLPGFTEEGKKVAPRAMVRMGGGVGPADALDWVMASVMNRHLALNPSLKAVGLGAAPQAPRGWVWVMTAAAPRLPSDGPVGVLYPGMDQQDVPLYLGREAESLLAGAANDTVVGFAVTANFFPTHKVGKVAAKLADSAGADVPCWLSTPEKPLPGAGGYNQILLAPKAGLRPATTYSATMSAEVNGAKWERTWNFSTLDHARYRVRTTEALLKRVNEVRSVAGLDKVSLDENLSKGCQAHAEYIARNADHPNLQGLGIHDEDQKLPGATMEGARAGKASVIAIISDPIDSLDSWLATLYHRLPLLNPKLSRVGYGQTQHPTRGWVTVMESASGK